MTDYYHRNARAYFNKTVSVDPAGFLSGFINCLPPGARILDAGCGSGRDLLWLKNQGFSPTGFERAPDLAALAEEASGCPVIRGDFTTYDFSSITVDAILLSGGFVHIGREQLLGVFKNVLNALAPGGHVYLSMKQGRRYRRATDGRVFILWEDHELRQVFDNLKLRVNAFSTNCSALKTGETWLAYILASAGE